MIMGLWWQWPKDTNIMLWWWRESIFLYLIFSRTNVDESEHNHLNMRKKEKLTEFLSLNSVDWRMFFPSKNSMWVQIQRYFSIVLLFLNSGQVEEGKGKQRDNQSQKTKHCFILGKVIIVTTRFHSAMVCNGGAESKNQNSCFSPYFVGLAPFVSCKAQELNKILSSLPPHQFHLWEDFSPVFVLFSWGSVPISQSGSLRPLSFINSSSPLCCKNWDQCQERRNLGGKEK